MRFTHTAPCLETLHICVHKSKQLSIWLVVDTVTRCQHRRSLRTKTCLKRNIACGDETRLKWKTILLAFHDAVRHWKIYTVCAVMYIHFLFSPSDGNMTDMSGLTNAKAIYLNECTKLFMYSICTWWIPKNLNTWDIKSSVRVISHFLHPSSVWEQEVEMDKKQTKMGNTPSVLPLHSTGAQEGLGLQNACHVVCSSHYTMLRRQLLGSFVRWRSRETKLEKARRTGGLQICRGRELMEQVDETFLGRLPPRFKRFPSSIPTFLFFYLREKVSTSFCYLLSLKTDSRIWQILKRSHIMQTSR